MPLKNDRAMPTDRAIVNPLSGASHFPSAQITLSGVGSICAGTGSVGRGAGQCLELIGSTIVLSSRSTLASACSGLAGSVSGGSVVTV
jgi:hypothetical protein